MNNDQSKNNVYIYIYIYIYIYELTGSSNNSNFMKGKQQRMKILKEKNNYLLIYTLELLIKRVTFIKLKYSEN